MIEQITESIHVETGVRGCNHSFVVTSDGVVMIDTPQFPSDAVKWRDLIAGFGSVLYIINNEPHGDHVAGNFFFKGTVVAHEGTRTAVLATPASQYVDMVKQMEPASLPLVDGYSYRPPTMTFSERMTLHVGKHTFELMHLPGHTPSQTAVYVPEDKVLFTSDNVVRGTMPFVTPQAMPFEWVRSLQRMQELDVKVVVPGHGGICDKPYLGEMTAGIQGWIDVVSDAVKKGMSREEAQEKINMIDRYRDSPNPPERLRQTQRMNVARLYEVLTQKTEAH